MVKKFAWYPTDDEKKQFKRRKPQAGKLRKGIEPGRVLILLSGRFRGKRVVFLKQLESGLLLVTGPYKYNGVPLKRVNQVYTLTTSTKVDIKGVDASKVDDKLFKKDKKTKGSQESKFFAEGAKVTIIIFMICCRRRKCLRKDWTHKKPLILPLSITSRPARMLFSRSILELVSPSATMTNLMRCNSELKLVPLSSLKVPENLNHKLFPKI